jgi:hypothetical protein
MTAKTQSDRESATAHDEEFDALQSILTTQSKAVSYEEAAGIGRELISFFEALGEENEQVEEENNA